ncbi:MAG: anti-sigma factor family protein [Gemmatimonadota bacterium]
MAMDRFTCREVFRRLDDFVDRELSPGEVRLVEDHLERCAACASEYRFEASVVAELRAKIRRIQVPEDLMARISRKLAELERIDAADGA